MSIFPKRIRPPGRVTLHCRIGQTPVARAVSHRVLRGAVIDPEGNETEVLGRRILLAPPSPRARTPAPLHHISDALDEEFAATMLRHVKERLDAGDAPERVIETIGVSAAQKLDRARLEYVLTQLLVLRSSTHFYAHFDVSAEAPLGRYRFRLGSVADGHVSVSSTASDDDLLVEQLSLVSIARGAHGSVASVMNPSPEAVMAELIEVDGPVGRRQARTTERTLAPRRATELSFSSATAFVAYADGTERIWLGDRADPLVLRSPWLRWAVDRDSARVKLEVPAALATEAGGELATATGGLARSLLTGDAVILSPDESSVWRTADGFATRSLLVAEHRAAYEALIDSRLVSEVRE